MQLMKHVKFRTKNWDLKSNYHQIKFKITMLMSILFDYSDECILVKGPKTIAANPPAVPIESINKQYYKY